MKKMKTGFPFLFSFLLLFFFATGAISEEMIKRSPTEETHVTLGPTSIPGLGGLYGSDGAVIIIQTPEVSLEGEEEIMLGDTGKPGLGGLTGSKALRITPPADENISESTEQLGDTGNPGLGGISGARI